MLYILPPPTNPSPPSVWDLILNFHRKGCQDSDSPSPHESPSRLIKFSSKGQHDGSSSRKTRRSWGKTSPLSPTTPLSSSSNQHKVRVKQIMKMKKAKVHPFCCVLLTSKKETIVQRSISLSRKKNNQMQTLKISFPIIIFHISRTHSLAYYLTF